MSKDKVINALKEKAKFAEESGKLITQSFGRSEIDERQLLKDFVNARKEYHVQEILKVKVA